MPSEPGPYHLRWRRTQYADDGRPWMHLPGEVRCECLRRRPNDDITRLLENRCPRCGASYLTTATG